MVIDQGTMLDRIDYNIENMNTEVKEAEKELVVAKDYQKRYTKRKIMFLLLLVIVGLIVVLGIKGGKKDAPAAATPPPPATDVGQEQGDGKGGGNGEEGEQRADPIGTLVESGPQPDAMDAVRAIDPNGVGVG